MYMCINDFMLKVNFIALYMFHFICLANFLKISNIHTPTLNTLSLYTYITLFCLN